jgi:hypothetical protein
MESTLHLLLNGTIANGVGLLTTFSGAVVASRGSMVSAVDAKAFSATMWNENTAQAKALLRQSKLAKLGLGIVAVGTAFQFVGLVQQAIA